MNLFKKAAPVIYHDPHQGFEPFAGYYVKPTRTAESGLQFHGIELTPSRRRVEVPTGGFVAVKSRAQQLWWDDLSKGLEDE